MLQRLDMHFELGMQYFDWQDMTSDYSCSTVFTAYYWRFMVLTFPVSQQRVTHPI